MPAEVLGTISAIFLLLLAGYAARRFGVLKPGDASVVNAIIIYLTLPAFIFTALYGTRISGTQVLAPVIGLGGEIIVLGLAYLTARAMKLDRRTTGGLMLVAAFANTGFLGYPLTIAAFPGDRQALTTAVMFDQFGMAIPLYSIGIAVASVFGSKQLDLSGLVAFLKTPVFPVTIIALLVKNLPVPQPILASLSYMGAATVPLAMISIGLALTGGHLVSSIKPLIAVIVLKMAILPLLVYVGMTAAGASGTVLNVSVMQAATPSAVMAGVIAGRYGNNGPFAASAVFATTILSLVTIPLVLMLLR